MKHKIFVLIACVLFSAPLWGQNDCCTGGDEIAPCCLAKFDAVSSAVRAEYAPDEREKVFDVRLLLQGGKKVAKGSTTEASAKEALLKGLADAGMAVEDEIVLLPDATLKGKTYGVICVSMAQFNCEGKMDGESATHALMGMPVTILENNDNDWTRAINIEGYIAWTLTRNIQAMTREEFDDYLSKPKVIATVRHSTLYSKPDKESMQISDIILGDILIDCGEFTLQDLNTELVPTEGDGMRIFIDPYAHHKTYTASEVKKLNRTWKKVAIADGRVGYVEKEDFKDVAEWIATATPTEENIVETAKLFLGTPYTWGGASYKGVDCSGLSKCVYYLNGYVIKRDASQQCLTGDQIDIQKFSDGEETLENLSNLRPGDLVFFGRKATPQRAERITHVAIYIGGGYIIHSSNIVKINTLLPGYPNSYNRTPIRATRIIGTADQGKGVESIGKVNLTK